ncbi:MAG: RIP metalloprotease RseP [Hyphomicrobiales bacterium]|nr:RIP metalloprotease RseP [Hyphomicrobiales bacterium]
MLADLATPLTYVFAFLFVLGVVIFVHELGHFLAARWCGVEVETFSIGFGPQLAGFRDRQGTLWRLAALPLGGYVKFKGDENAASMPDAEKLATLTPEGRRGNFHTAPLRHRAFIVFAGPLANFVMAFAVFSLFFMTVGRTIIDPRVSAVEAGSAAERAGLKPGDRVLQIGGSVIRSFDELQRVVMQSPNQELLLLVDRDGVSTALRATPELREVDDRQGGTVKIGVLGIVRSNAPDDIRRETYDPLTALSLGLNETWFQIQAPIIFIRNLIAGQGDANMLGGPIRIAEISGKVASAGFDKLIWLTAVISVSIGLLNLFPIPILDGGHLLYYGIEAILGRPLSQAAQEVGFRIGLVLLVMLMIFATKNDVSRYF